MAAALGDFFGEIHNSDRTLAFVNRSSPDAVENLLASLFGEQSIPIEDLMVSDERTETVVLLEDGEVIAESTVDELLQSVLMVNTDIYKTGARSLPEISVPDVLEGLDEMPFRVRGYPASDKEKLLMVAMSRVIERLAAESLGGTLRASFQRLSRVTDEQGTERVYQTVGNSATNVDVYGVDDWETPSLPVTVHTGTSAEYRRSWVVVFTPPEGGRADADHAALVALEDEPNLWDGFWTFRPAFVRRIDRYIAGSL